jgi:hypothetical protein
MNQPNQLIARLKTLMPTPGYSWWWDFDQWALLLSDEEEEVGYIAFARKNDSLWHVRAIVDDADGAILSSDHIHCRQILRPALLS